ncbi:MAG: GyrI-like domain-containing protein [Flavobacteriaceae bacterium]|nr:GyrI-like domain-containing protein [Flavobacteriaceae bacterium]
MKHEWRKKEKQLYIPKATPEIVELPAFNFFTIRGQGNPNDSFFAEYISVLYALSYGVKMGLKKENTIANYVDYTVYPLEGVWDINDEAKKNYIKNTAIHKDDLVFTLMIRQPNFVNQQIAVDVINKVKKKKYHPLLEEVKFESIEEGKCIQMLHIGSYDNEPITFNTMEQYAESIGLQRVSKVHREIYLSDFRKVPVEKLKTTLRFQVQ